MTVNNDVVAADGNEEVVVNDEVVDPDPSITTPDPERQGGVQKRMDELTKGKRKAEHEAAYWRGKAEGKIETQTPTPTPIVQKTKELDPNDFDNDADYLRAVATETMDEIRAEQEKDKKQVEENKTRASINQHYDEARKKHNDWDTVALNPAIAVTTEMFDAAKGESLGDILYYLGSNPAEATKISSLPAVQQIKEIGKIENNLAVVPPVTLTNAPDPPTILGGGSVISKKEEDMNRTELHKKWNEDRIREAGL